MKTDLSTNLALNAFFYVCAEIALHKSHLQIYVFRSRRCPFTNSNPVYHQDFFLRSHCPVHHPQYAQTLVLISSSQVFIAWYGEMKSFNKAKYFLPRVWNDSEIASSKVSFANLHANEYSSSDYFYFLNIN